MPVLAADHPSPEEVVEGALAAKLSEKWIASRPGTTLWVQSHIFVDSSIPTHKFKDEESIYKVTWMVFGSTSFMFIRLWKMAYASAGLDWKIWLA